MLVSHVFIKKHNFNAGKWIYEGYQQAWQALGYTTHYYDNLSEIKDFKDEYYLMASDSEINNPDSIDIIKKSQKTFLYVQPNKFPLPWGRHPNFFSLCPDQYIEKLNNLENVYQWCFGRVTEYHHKWSSVHYLPLAYDSINYKDIKDRRYEFDVCFIGGWANNGFNEKRQIMINHFKKFKDTDIKCGIFINRDLSNDVEMKILSNSKISLNIHDAYQRKLGLDTNERTFKSLGLCGYLISDQVDEVSNLFPDLKTSSDPDKFVDLVRQALNTSCDELNFIKKQNKLDIMNNHTYINRVEQLIKL